MKAITTAFNNIRKQAGLPQFRVYDCRVQAITKLLSNPSVSPQVSKEIAGHISQAMQSHYSIQQFDTKMAALDALEHPTVRPQNEPTPPLQPPTSAAVIHPAIQAEIDRLRAEIARLADRQFDSALQERSSAPNMPDKPARPRRRRKSASGDPTEVIFHLRRSAKNLIRASSRSTDKAVALLIEAEHRRSLELGTGGTAPTLEAIKAKEKAERFAVPPVQTPQPTGEHEQGGEISAVHRTDRPAARQYSAEPAVTPAMGLREAGRFGSRPSETGRGGNRRPWNAIRTTCVRYCDSLEICR